MSQSETLGQALIGLLADHGVERVFGVPGVQTLELFRGLTSYGMSHALSRTEQAAGFAADAFARTTGTPGVVVVIGGPGITNAATPIAQAYHDSVPLLVIAAVTRPRGQPPGGTLHDLPDQVGFARTIVGSAEHVADPESLPRALATAFSAFSSGRPRPSYIEVPAELLEATAPRLEAELVSGERTEPDARDVGAVADLLKDAQRPLVVAGGGAQGADVALQSIAELLDSPVVTTLNGKGVLPDDHPLAIGSRLPTGTVLDELDQADVVLAVGTEFCDTDYYYAGRGPKISGSLAKLDIDLSELARGPAADVFLHADASRGLTALIAALGQAPCLRGGAERARRIRRDATWWPQAQVLEPVVTAIGENLHRDAITAVDSCQLAYAGQNMWPAFRPRSWLIPHGFGTLGSALPMAIGASYGAPGRPVVAVTGDGGLQYTLAEVASAAMQRLPLAILLWDNDGYQEMRDEMRARKIPIRATDAVIPDWTRVLSGLGFCVKQPSSLDELGRAMSDFGVERAPTVIRVRAELAR